jgi:carbonic anhydrase/acetyltransferase-like protein (isoleucine patch superfamily)
MSIDPTAFIHPLAFVCGDVTLGARASVWPFAVVRADSDRIEIGADSNLQDGAVVHTDPGLVCSIGARVVVGHRAIVHGATVRDDVLIGMGAIVLNRAEVGSGSIVGAGALVTEGMVVPPNSLVLGAPARVVRETTAEHRAGIHRAMQAYLGLQYRHAAGEFPRHVGARAGEDADR